MKQSKFNLTKKELEEVARNSYKVKDIVFIKASATKRIRANNFILKSSIKHNYLFDYKNVYKTYDNRDSEVELICSLHGKFITTTRLHIESKYGGCKKCHEKGEEHRRLKLKRKTRLNKTEINELKRWSYMRGGIYYVKNNTPAEIRPLSLIHKATQKYNYRYDYRYVPHDFKNGKTSVKIICPEHGEFWYNMAIHSKPSGSSGCRGCGLVNRRNNPHLKSREAKAKPPKIKKPSRCGQEIFIDKRCILLSKINTTSKDIVDRHKIY